ncbi:MAG: 16S rRNA (cytosine(1402)-N(4))-methyltransferase RsmH, partial [Flavobacteriales bacterium]|jgi:16S rRNA (cytosine1402-N4)-methyltransferase|uniref:16S rRNA (cytosine(1402)-N(4))-methyltransferase RsmH n=1 Tax=Blattabacterium sp. (Mastotermes darwiniensis) TaxID=39768 RepID=UPI000231DFA2|nr:16S rRNA (cytosine(1402)-N(4))-methyltransferase RsmH [Blattabacterium sp. (Mastotermes darwiniensis)]AER40442.1 16S rRNA m(4)C1402 methyltransferase, SAM-dependent [Blattabacterium sp. (Mastotermes darwiniensis) str. MADAR]MDR1805042.1 16S rRNA (cytosine(1402)-N(4))-methyltransferase RsmH [Flavobacteriales bacterium]
MNLKPYHKPVLIKESIDNLVTDRNGIYIDVTFGGGGHSYEILKRLDKGATLIALDQDKESIKNNLIKDGRFHLFHKNFIHLKQVLKVLHIKKVSGLLADLGLSSLQMDNPIRGFSHQLNCTLDMRMNQENTYSALHVLNEYSKKELIHVFYKYGEFKNAAKISEKILARRLKKPIKTTFDLRNIFILKKSSFKERKRFFARLFQSIRMEVNNEINILKDLLLKSSEIILPGGRISVISYHSIEDRITKYFLKRGFFFKETNNIDTIPFKIIHKKVIKPSPQEIRENPRSRSARLRIAEKL